MQLFGFEIKRKEEEQPQIMAVNQPSFVPPVNDDGAVIVSGGGVVGTYVDLEGTARTEAELITRYRQLSLQPEIETAVETLNKQISEGYSVLGEVDHPDDLKINLDRVSHMISSMWMDGANGFGKLKILPTPMGQLVSTMLESGVKLGVSSRGSGNVNDMDGKVSDFEIVTVDIVAQPSAPNAYPKAIYEGMMNMKHGHKLLDIAKDARGDKKVEKYLKEEVMRLIKDLKINKGE